MEKQIEIAVIGAGASGMMAAITAARSGARVTVFEKNDRVGKKILSTGNGKCNLSNIKFSTDYYYCSDKDKLHEAFQIFGVWDTIPFFEDCGLMIKNKDGYLYPYCEQASAVLDTLRMEMIREGIKVLTETEIVNAVYRNEKERFKLKDKQGKNYSFDKLIVTCGSQASLKKGEGFSGYSLAESFGHNVVTVVPGLVQLKSDDDFCKALAGVRSIGKVKLFFDDECVGTETGEIQFTEYGVSGIPIFQMSRLVAYGLKKRKNIKIHIDFFPEIEENAYSYLNRVRYDSHKDRTVEEFLTGTLNKKINMVLIKKNGLKPGMRTADISYKELQEILKQFRAFPIHISAVNAMENAQVCAGGVDLCEMNEQMESKLVPGLYFAGELVDVDGKCGGYNLQWAWTSGYIAGRSAAGYVADEITTEMKE